LTRVSTRRGPSVILELPARAGVRQAVIYDVAVLPEYQNKGIGSKIIEYLIQSSTVDVIMLYANPGKETFYEKYGFRKMKTAMAIMRNTDECREKGFIE
jgi:aralkylamine N-acetyltransferase